MNKETVEQALNLAQAELRAMYKRLDIKGSNVLDIIDNALSETQATTPTISDASKNKVQLSNIIDQNGISETWLKIWEQVEMWYGDPHKEETGKDLLLRLQKTYSTPTIQPSAGDWKVPKDLFAEIKLEIGNIQFQHLSLSNDKNYIEANPATHRIALYTCLLLEQFHKECQSNESQPSEAGEGNKEFILCAANFYQDGEVRVHNPKNIETGFITCGRRHHNCISAFSMIVGFPYNEASQAVQNTEVQGFLTNTNRFVDRKEAFQIARLANQIHGPNKGQQENSIGLTSEDLY